MKNPFPGMNPYLEGYWPDVHTALVASIREQLGERLPEDLVPRAEERVTIAEDGEHRNYRPDIAVTETWPDEGLPPLMLHEGSSVVAEPTIIQLELERERWVEIRDSSGRLITVIEVLSPTNKSDEGQAHYERRRRDFLAGGANVVEIDLLRRGRHTLAAPKRLLPVCQGTTYWICVSRVTRPNQREVYALPLQEPLPAIRVPLRPTDHDVPLALQPLVNRCFETGRYWKLNHRRDPEPPFSPDESRWLDEQLRRAGLR
ncbi:MAG: DUF4058 family protein [Verrucomicrobia bacterium]|nr:DUF4058 family protein [Verrucomicrobiota bacterium]